MLRCWACHYKDLPDGRRQIVGFLIPANASRVVKAVSALLASAG